MTGLLLFAHGARDPAWALPFQAVLARVQALRPECTVALAFLELMQPDLRSAAEAMVAAGCERIRVVPLFLGTGGHVRRDLPLLIEALTQAHPAVSFELAGAVGETPDVIEAMAQVAASGAAE